MRLLGPGHSSTMKFQIEISIDIEELIGGITHRDKATLWNFLYKVQLNPA